jgi:hypothetical protein
MFICICWFHYHFECTAEFVEVVCSLLCTSVRCNTRRRSCTCRRTGELLRRLCGLDDSGFEPWQAKGVFSLLHMTLTSCAVHIAACLMGNSHFPAGVERLGRGAAWYEWIYMFTPRYAFVGVFMGAFTFTYVCIATFCPECSVSLILRIATAHSLCVLIAVYNLILFLLFKLQFFAIFRSRPCRFSLLKDTFFERPCCK